jgi:hypothetical protein
MSVRRRREAGQRRKELLVVASDRDRQILELARAQFLTHFGAIGLQQRRFRGDGDGFLQLVHRQRCFDAGDAVERHRHVAARERLKARHRDDDGVGPGLHRRESVGAGRVAGRLARRLGFVVSDGNGGARQHAAGRVFHGADNRPIEHLCFGGGQEERCGHYGENQKRPAHGVSP